MVNPPQPGDGGKPAGDPPTFTQEVRHSNVGARVPEKVARGVFSTGVLVLQWHTEFILDFVLRMSQPHQLAARVVTPIAFMPRLIGALRENLENYRKAFGPPSPLPTPPTPARSPSIDEIYDGLKIPDNALGGAYANAVMVSHSPSDFCFDFITDFYPRATVTARIFLSASHVPIMLTGLTQSWQQYQAKLQQGTPAPPAE